MDRRQRELEKREWKEWWRKRDERFHEKYDSHIRTADRILAGEGWSQGWSQEERKFVEDYRGLLKAGVRPDEDQQRRFKLYEWFLANPPPPVRLLPKSRAVAMAVDAVTAENARARPESIRIATRDENGMWRVAVIGRNAVGWIRGDKFIPDEVKPDEGGKEKVG